MESILSIAVVVLFFSLVAVILMSDSLKEERDHYKYHYEIECKMYKEALDIIKKTRMKGE